MSQLVLVLIIQLDVIMNPRCATTNVWTKHNFIICISPKIFQINTFGYPPPQNPLDFIFSFLTENCTTRSLSAFEKGTRNPTSAVSSTFQFFEADNSNFPRSSFTPDSTQLDKSPFENVSLKNASALVDDKCKESKEIKLVVVFIFFVNLN
eukprot:maker-scaffold_21-snap-gene-2.1-mRNA-1 protein AED:0.31 eAED:0.31 QI:0/0.33/0.25/1/0/0/4/26/150